MSMTSALTTEPATFSIVRAISIKGSMARIGPIRLKEEAIPTPDRLTDAAIVAVPGIPAMPSEPRLTTMMVMIIILKSIGEPVRLQTYTMSRDGKIPAQPCMPAVVPNPATKLAVP